MILADGEGELEITVHEVEPPMSPRAGDFRAIVVSRRWASTAPMSTFGSLPTTSNASSKPFASSNETGAERLNLPA